MSRVCDITGKKANIQRVGTHDSTKSRSGGRAFAFNGPNKFKGVKRVKRQGINLVTVRTPLGKLRVSMKAYKSYFKRPWKAENAA